jgi:hypothetical protein
MSAAKVMQFEQISKFSPNYFVLLHKNAYLCKTNYNDKLWIRKTNWKMEYFL